MSMLDTLFTIFKGANPDASDEDIKSHISSLKATPDQMGSALAPLSSSQPDMSLKFSDVNSTPSNFETNISDNTVTNNGKPESLPSQSMPTEPLTPEPVAPPPPSTPVAPTKAAAQAPSVSKVTPPEDVPNTTDELKTALAPAPSHTSEAATELANKNKDLKKVGAVSGLFGGVGDAIGNAAVPFGGKGSSGTQDQILENTNAQVDKNKALFEDQQKKDPNSEISRHYQKVLGLMLGKHADSMNVSQMSAEHIAQTLPEVEKYMQKELGLSQIKSNKDLQMSMHQQDHQDKLEKETREWVDNLSKARNGEIGVQNGKVDQARHLLQLYKQAEETGKPITNSQYGELAIGAASLVAGGAQNVSDHTRQMIMQSTAKGDINKALTYAGFDPSSLGGSTEAVLKNLKDTIIRQGMEAEHQRNKFLEDQKATAPSGYHGPLRETLLNHEYGNSIKEFVPQTQATNKQPAVKHPQDAEALDWAKTHTNDPRAAKILKANGF